MKNDKEHFTEAGVQKMPKSGMNRGRKDYSTKVDPVLILSFSARAVCGESRTYGSYRGKARKGLPIGTDPLKLNCSYLVWNAYPGPPPRSKTGAGSKGVVVSLK
jgi:hypothetical protein